MKKSNTAILMSILTLTLVSSTSPAFAWVRGVYYRPGVVYRPVVGRVGYGWGWRPHYGWGYSPVPGAVVAGETVGTSLGASTAGSSAGAAAAPVHKEDAQIERINLELDHYQAGQGASLLLVQEMDDFKDYLIGADYPNAANLKFDDLIKIYSEQNDLFAKSLNEMN